MKIAFTKMQSLGNDFVVIDASQCAILPEQLPIKNMACRHTGIGFDQLLWLDSAEKADIACRIFNADGSEAEQCGNGMRCVARYLQEVKKLSHSPLTIQTATRVVTADIQSLENITINMGSPKMLGEKTINVADQSWNLSLVDMGNPHAIIEVDAIDLSQVEKIGKLISIHSEFPKGINVGFMRILNKNSIELRTFERGVGLTLSCGSNACAAVASGINNKKLNQKVEVQLELGKLIINLSNPETLYMQGPANKSFEGIIKIGE